MKEKSLSRNMRLIFTAFFLTAFLSLLTPLTCRAVGVNWCTQSYDNQGGDKLFDGSYLTKWCAQKTWEFAYYIVWENYGPSRIASYTITTAGDTATYPDRNPISWTLYGSNTTTHYWGDSINQWDVIDSRTNCQTLKAENYTAYNFTLDRPVNAYKYYYLRIEHDNDSYCMQISELTFYDHVHSFSNNICTSCGCRIGKLADDYGNAIPAGGNSGGNSGGSSGGNSGGNSGGSSGSISAPITLSQPVLSQPAQQTTGIQLSWNKVSKATGYQIYRKKNSGSYTRIATVKSGSTLSYTDKSVTSGNLYTYKIRAYYTPSSGSATYSNYSAAKKSLFLSKTTLSSVKNTTKGIQISWKKVTGASGYQIYRKTGSGSYQKIKTVSGKLSYTDTNVAYGKKYTYKVRAWRKNSSVLYCGAFSSTKALKSTKAETNIANMTVSLSYYTKRYSGSALKPAVTVKNEVKTLKAGTDYTAAYSNNKKVGTAKVKIKGKGSYTGTKTVTFQIISSGSSGTCGKSAGWALSGNTLYISGTGTMTNYSTTNVPWYKYRAKIKKVQILSGITSIGQNAFMNCSNLTSVSIPSTVTKIGGGAFRNCTALKKITIPAKVTTIGYCAFQYCPALETVTLGSGLKTIDDCAFQDCVSLKAINLPAKLETIGMWAFEDCVKLTSITFPASLTHISNYAFDYCDNLTSITFKGDAVSIGTAFQYVTARVYYPKNNSSWKKKLSQSNTDFNYGGDLTWIGV